MEGDIGMRRHLVYAPGHVDHWRDSCNEEMRAAIGLAIAEYNWITMIIPLTVHTQPKPSPKTTRLSSRGVSLGNKAKLQSRITECRILNAINWVTKNATAPSNAQNAVISSLCQNTAITISCK